MVVLIICKYKEDLIKKKKPKVGDTCLLFRSRAQKSWLTGPILTEFELEQDFMSVLVTCKSEEAQIKMDEKSWRHLFP